MKAVTIALFRGCSDRHADCRGGGRTDAAKQQVSITSKGFGPRPSVRVHTAPGPTTPAGLEHRRLRLSRSDAWKASSTSVADYQSAMARGWGCARILRSLVTSCSPCSMAVAKISRSAGSPGKEDGNETAVSAIAGVSGRVRTRAASCSSHERMGMATTIRSFFASQASSNHETAATVSSSASVSAWVAALLTRSGSADHQ